MEVKVHLAYLGNRGDGIRLTCQGWLNLGLVTNLIIIIIVVSSQPNRLLDSISLTRVLSPLCEVIKYKEYRYGTPRAKSVFSGLSI